METNSIVFKGTVNGLTIIFKEDSDFTTILEQMEKKIESAGKFFKGAILDVRYRGKKLEASEEIIVHELLIKKSGAKIKSFLWEIEEPVKQQEIKQPIVPKKLKMKSLFFKGIEEGVTKFYRGTVRSGQLINFDGNLVVIGDVNPGGELIASGNVIVMGSLRGIVHAGADGNKEAVVVALALQPTQLRIADVITRSPDEKDIRSGLIPELAYIKDNIVYIDRFLPQR